ncbi:IclR family transcriptional regulator [Microbacterium sp. Leaf320]|uniref:IclR family transcriptional regulator n=1 Tax=Microbacterium sp. Leaf320 TaxID=1736334 RepID=UPI0006F58834|nr:IclR family transcriptional regulator [Microbacterium sp. Leaf320]KQQ68695.1 IclR family transcriptional regulator [Microbacterium sp. Leaf320]
MPTTEAAPTLIGSVQRALRLVDIVANSARPVSVKGLAALTGLTLGTTYNLVRTLIHEGYLANEPDGLVLGASFPVFRAAPDAGGVLLARVRSALREVTEAVGETAYLSRYHDGEMRLVDIVDAARTPRIDLSVALESSAHATALGKQILTDLTCGERLDYLSRHRLEELTPRTISDRSALLAELERSPGFALDREEYAIGNMCVAVPVIAPNFVASLAISLPADRAHVDRGLVSKLKQSASRLSLQLGADVLTDGEPGHRTAM